VGVIQIYDALIKLLGKRGGQKGLDYPVPTDNNEFIIFIDKDCTLGVMFGLKPCFGQLLVLQFQHLRTHVQEHADLGSFGE
jgi:hypothetical protein